MSFSQPWATKYYISRTDTVRPPDDNDIVEIISESAIRRPSFNAKAKR